MFRTTHPERGGWYVDMVVTPESATDEDGNVGDTEGTVGPFEFEWQAERTAENFEDAPHVVSWSIRHEESPSYVGLKKSASS